MIPTKFLESFSPEEIRTLEREYGAKVIIDKDTGWLRKHFKCIERGEVRTIRYQCITCGWWSPLTNSIFHSASYNRFIIKVMKEHANGHSRTQVPKV